MKDATLQLTALATAVAAIVGAVLFIGGTDPKTGFPDPITVDGQTIEFTWTDDNTGEDLHIYTDRATYTDGLSHATVYVAVANRSGVTQDVELIAHFRDTKKRIEDVQVLAEVTREVYEPVYIEKCDDLAKDATSSFCYQEQTGTTTTLETVTQWVPLDTVVRTPIELAKETTRLQSKELKPVEDFIAEKKTEGYTIPVGGVVYYKVHVEFPANEDDNFYFSAVGSLGAYGHLDPWFNSSWPYRIKIEVNSAKVGTTSAVTNYPVYLDLGGLPASFWTNASSTGADIRITESDGSTETAFELVSFSTTTKRGELHFLADSLSTTSTSTFYIYYGNPSAAAYAVTDTYGRNNVWTIYAGVWHMENNPNDSTSNGYNFTELNSPTYTEEGIGRSLDFGSANTNKGLRIINTLLGFSSATQDWTKTVTAKVETQPTTGQVQQFFNRMYGETVGTQIRLYYINNSGTNRIVVQNDGGGVIINHAVTLTTDEYTRVAATKVGSILTLYVNGVPIATGTSTGTLDYSIYTDEMTIGLQRTGVGNAFKGHQDEARLAQTGFSSAFILTEYNNQSATSSFFYIGAQETATGTSTQVYPTDTVIMFD